ncbi:9354_t:CDS:1, partial [Funneliformis mosseae]
HINSYFTMNNNNFLVPDKDSSLHHDLQFMANLTQFYLTTTIPISSYAHADEKPNLLQSANYTSSLDITINALHSNPDIFRFDIPGFRIVVIPESLIDMQEK